MAVRRLSGAKQLLVHHSDGMNFRRKTNCKFQSKDLDLILYAPVHLALDPHVMK
jgi:hypothetical protein